MRAGIVSDIHGNHIALRQAIAMMGDVDRLICLGDVIDQSTFSNEVVAVLMENDALTIRGNHEEMFFSPLHPRARSAPDIRPGLLAWLESRPRRIVEEMAGRQVMLTHATAWSETYEYVYPHSRSFQRFGEGHADIILYGHTHQPVVRKVGESLVVNPGSVGQGRLVGDAFVMSYAIVDFARREAETFDFLTS